MALTHPVSLAEVQKTPSGIAGFDQLTSGGLPKGRSTLVCGGPGSGKTIFAVEFLVRGAELGEPGVFITFEESVDDLTRNVASLGFDLARAFACDTEGYADLLKCTTAAIRQPIAQLDQSFGT